MSTESRGELLSWVNDLLQSNYTRIEQMGTGAVHCQIMDSIYNDVQLSKVNLAANQEYQYVNNFKVLQTAFAAHHIDKPIPVERLIKLKFQDNLEFLQWMKKFWDANYPGGYYDVVGRRGGSVQTTSGSSQPRQPSAGLTRSSPPPLSQPTSQEAQQHRQQPNHKAVDELRNALTEMEKERDFYFGKLRDIEIMTQKIVDPLVTESSFFKQVTQVLYATEDGFEIPNGGELLNAK